MHTWYSTSQGKSHKENIITPSINKRISDISDVNEEVRKNLDVLKEVSCQLERNNLSKDIDVKRKNWLDIARKMDPIISRINTQTIGNWIIDLFRRANSFK